MLPVVQWQVKQMPSISTFHDITVYLYFFDNQKVHAPHIHAEFEETVGVFMIGDAEMVDGDLPDTQARLVSIWIELHRAELMENWKAAMSGQSVHMIDPLT